MSAPALLGRALLDEYARWRRPAAARATADSFAERHVEADDAVRRERALLAQLADHGYDVARLSPDRLPRGAREITAVEGRVVARATDDERFPADKIEPAGIPGLAPERLRCIASIAATALAALLAHPWDLDDPVGGGALEVRVVALGTVDRAAHAGWRHVAVSAANDPQQDARAVARAVFELTALEMQRRAGQGRRPWDALVLGGSAVFADWLLGRATGTPPIAADVVHELGASIEDTSGVPVLGTSAASLWRELGRHVGREHGSTEDERAARVLHVTLGATCALPPDAPRAAALRTALRWLGGTGAFDRLSGALSRQATPWAAHVAARALADERAPGCGVDLARGAAHVEPIELAAFTTALRWLWADMTAPWGVVRVALQETAGLEDALVQVLRIGERGEVLGIARAGGSCAALEVDARAARALIAVVSARAQGGRGRLHVSALEPRALLEVTAADRIGGVEHELAFEAWTWRSCDIAVEDERACAVDPPRATRVRVRVRNRGDRTASGLVVRARWQPWAGEPDANAWRACLDWNGTESAVEITALSAGAACWTSLPWRPDAVADAAWIEVVASTRDGAQESRAVTFAGAPPGGLRPEARPRTVCPDAGDFRALPPGMAPEELLRKVVREDGEVRAGASYRLVSPV